MDPLAIATPVRRAVVSSSVAPAALAAAAGRRGLHPIVLGNAPCAWDPILALAQCPSPGTTDEHAALIGVWLASAPRRHPIIPEALAAAIALAARPASGHARLALAAATGPAVAHAHLAAGSDAWSSAAESLMVAGLPRAARAARDPGAVAAAAAAARLARLPAARGARRELPTEVAADGALALIACLEVCRAGRPVLVIVDSHRHAAAALHLRQNLEAFRGRVILAEIGADASADPPPSARPTASLLEGL